MDFVFTGFLPLYFGHHDWCGGIQFLAMHSFCKLAFKQKARKQACKKMHGQKLYLLHTNHELKQRHRAERSQKNLDHIVCNSVGEIQLLAMQSFCILAF